jgi:site-specific recombinase XerD
MIEPQQSARALPARMNTMSLIVCDPEEAYPPRPKPRLLDQVRDAIRTRHYSYRTEEAYIGWIRRFILFHGKRHPAEMGRAEVERFLTSLAVDRHVAASTQNQALAALLFLYKDVLARDLGGVDEIRTVQELLGHRDVSTTMIDTHVLNRGGRGVQSPVDYLLGDRPRR